jgi:hypothetical protein
MAKSPSGQNNACGAGSDKQGAALMLIGTTLISIPLCGQARGGVYPDDSHSIEQGSPAGNRNSTVARPELHIALGPIGGKEQLASNHLL